MRRCTTFVMILLVVAVVSGDAVTLTASGTQSGISTRHMGVHGGSAQIDLYMDVGFNTVRYHMDMNKIQTYDFTPRSAPQPLRGSKQPKPPPSSTHSSTGRNGMMLFHPTPPNSSTFASTASNRCLRFAPKKTAPAGVESHL